MSNMQSSMFEGERELRAWAEAWCVLDGAARSSKKDLTLQAEVATYLVCKSKADEFERTLGRDPAAHLQRARGAVLQAARAKTWWMVALASTLPPALFCLLAGICLGAT